MTQPTPPIDLADLLMRVERMTHELGAVHQAITDAIAANANAATAAPLGTSTDTLRTLVTLGDTSRLPRSDRPVSDPQRRYLGDLLESKYARTDRAVVTMADASRAIGTLKAMPERAPGSLPPAPSQLPPTPPPAPAPVTVSKGLEEGTDYLPRNVLAVIPDGRYGVSNDTGTQTVFLRVVQQKLRDATGTLVRKVQYKSSDAWLDAQTYWPSGRVTGRREIHGTKVPDLLAQVMLDTGGCADRYSRRFSECCNCGRELTDAISRWYALGSDCIKKRADVVAYVEDLRGEWQPGMELRDWELQQVGA